MPLPLIIGGAIASLVIGKIISNAIESDDNKTCNPGPFDVLFNHLTSQKTSDSAKEANSPIRAVTTTNAKKEMIKDSKAASVDLFGSSSALASALESQRVQSQALVGLSGIANSSMICEAPSMNAYPGALTNAVGALAVPSGAKALGSGAMGVLNLDADTRKTAAPLASPTPASAAKKAAQYKATYGASKPTVANSQSIATTG